MEINNKRGVSGVVTAVLLILLVIAAVGIIWVVVQNFIGESTGGIEGSTDCFQNLFEVNTATYATTTSFNVVVERTSGIADIDKILIYHVSGGASTQVGEILTANVPSIGETGLGTGTLATGSLTDGDGVKITAVIGGVTCGLTDEKPITGFP